MSMTMDKLANGVILEVAGCPVNLIKMKLRESADEFIKRTDVLKDDTSGEAYPASFLDKYEITLRHGAISKLMLMDKRPWTSPQLAAYHKQQYNNGLTEELNSQSSGGIRA